MSRALTIETWINPADVTQWHPLVEWNNGSFGVNFAVADGAGAGQGSLWIDVKDISLNDHVLSSAAGLLVSNVWQHVAVTYTKSNGNTVLYINGVAKAQQALGAFTARTIGDLYFGLRPYDGGAGTRFAGLMDEVSLYNRALTAAEIQAVYNAGSAGKCRLPRVATATAVLAYDFCVAANITDGGYGYTNTPTVKIIGGGGSGAQAVAVVSNGVVIAVNVMDTGSGYSPTRRSSSSRHRSLSNPRWALQRCRA
jgi:hypothetical protein